MGHTYGFYSIATDLVGNVEGPKTAAEASTFVQGPCAANVTGSITVSRSGYEFNPGTRLFYQTVKLTNNSGTAITGPIDLVLDNLSSNATLSNEFGVTSCAAPLGSPYVANSTASLAPGATVSVSLEFSDPTKATTTYAARILAGAGIP